MEQNKKSSRREFLGFATAAIAAVISTAIGIPTIAYIIGPAFQRRTENWIGLGSTAKVALGEPTLFKAVNEGRQLAAFLLARSS